MCRSQAQGGRRCPGRHTPPSPPADGQTRIQVVTNKRSYTVIGGQSRVPWMRGERVESMDVIPASSPEPESRESYYGTKWQGYDEYQQRSAELGKRIEAGESITDIMRAEQLRRGQEMIAKIQREGW